MTLEIKDLTFADCMLVEFSVEKNLSGLLLAFEAYLADNSSKRIVNLYCTGILAINCGIKPEIYEDQKMEYSPDGFDQRANEIYEVSAVEKLSGVNITLKSDMLSLEALVRGYSITLMATKKY